MAENRQIFDEAMVRGREFRDKDQWDQALREYYRAATEFKKDLDARYGVALSLLRMGRADQALVQFEPLARLRAKDLEILRGYAETLAKLARTEDAIAILFRLRDIARENNQAVGQIEALSDIIALDENHTEAYYDIIEIYVNQGDNPSAASVGVELAKYYIRKADNTQALEILNDVLKLDPNNNDAPVLIKQLTNGTVEVINTSDLPDLDDLPEINENYGSPTPESLPPTTVAQPEPPVVVAPVSDATQLIADAESYLERGEVGRAIRHYEMAIEAGAERADVYYSLGQLYIQERQFEQAIPNLTIAVKDPEYGASAYFSLGQAYEGMHQYDQAVEAYELALSSIDLSIIDESAVDELIGMYEITADTYEKKGDLPGAALLYQRLADFIRENNFRTEKTTLALVRARELNSPIESTLASEEPQEPIIQKTTTDNLGQESKFGEELLDTSQIPGYSNTITFSKPSQNQDEEDFEALSDDANEPAKTVVAPDSGGIPQILSVFPTELINLDINQYAGPYLRAAEEFMKRDLLQAAIDASHELIRYFPNYLPAQAILAEIFVKKGWFEHARVKYQFIVDLYNLRNDSEKSIWSFRRLATISPQNMALRGKLANLLMTNGFKEEAAELLLDTIEGYIRSGQLDRALEECRKLRSLAPNSAPIRLKYGELFNQLERHNEALAEFRRALELEPYNLRALCLLNITIFITDQGDVRWTSFKSVLDVIGQDKATREKVITEYRQAQMVFNNPGISYAIGCLYVESQLWQFAIRSLDETIRAASGSLSNRDYELLASWELGQIYLDKSRYADAVEALSKVVSYMDKVDVQNFAPSTFRYGSLPSQSVIYRKLAKAFGAQGQSEYAIKALRTVKRLLPYERDVYFQLAELFFEQGQLPDALAELGELADHFEKLNQVENMIDVLREMERIAPNRIEVRDKLSQVYLQRGLTEQGLAELDELAELQRKNGRMKDAVRSLQKGAEVYMMMNNQQKAYDLYDRIVRIAPADIEARQQLVNIHILAGRIKDAIEEQRTIAQICLQNGNPQEAIGALHQVIALTPDDTRAYFTLADVLKNVNRFGEAYRLYGQILKREPENERAKNLQEQAKQKALETGQLGPEKVK
ncbi:MAG: tetratricopeptide repeat protein [Chloroflexi bacterium]|uniref:Tetratricopeptide repeat protein n=1 Tax=Candidatus Chlorohelix allophototropha TaxID=3003348 RepID=A0A8T7M855_9CHLR|nr:tetratricopeptide repeat protein [Chloroflexota bacterium]WJW68180.1 tetratricopeptide repeat protein [Chloroflexota bacterium L227-S17]